MTIHLKSQNKVVRKELQMHLFEAHNKPQSSSKIPQINYPPICSGLCVCTYYNHIHVFVIIEPDLATVPPFSITMRLPRLPRAFGTPDKPKR